MKDGGLMMNQFKTSRQSLMKSLASVLLFCLAALVLFIAGLMLGYGGIGEGKPLNILKAETWSSVMSYFKR